MKEHLDALSVLQHNEPTTARMALERNLRVVLRACAVTSYHLSFCNRPCYAIDTIDYVTGIGNGVTCAHRNNTNLNGTLLLWRARMKETASVTQSF